MRLGGGGGGCESANERRTAAMRCVFHTNHLTILCFFRFPKSEPKPKPKPRPLPGRGLGHAGRHGPALQPLHLRRGHLHVRAAACGESGVCLSLQGAKLACAAATIIAVPMCAVLSIYHINPEPTTPHRTGDHDQDVDAFYRLVHSQDPVPHAPPVILGFWHAPFELFYNKVCM